MKDLTKGKTVDTANFQPGELIHMEFAFYNVTSTCGLTSILTAVGAKATILWVFTTASRQAPVCIIRFILTTLKTEQHPWKYVRVDEDGALEKSTDVSSLLVDDFNISM